MGNRDTPNASRLLFAFILLLLLEKKVGFFVSLTHQLRLLNGWAEIDETSSKCYLHRENVYF